ncbi:tail fiber assembly protein [Spiribacter onubensis]|uniref:Tail fiber assembly protein n=1 Tax=Spiribacter onubensis TaxID=3122420 RepID=A0ABV3S958_9GAMM
MQVNSKEKLETYQVIGRRLRIHWDHVQSTVENESGESEIQWSCNEAVVDKHATRNEIVEAIISQEYPTYGAEIAAIEDGGDKFEDHCAARSLAKALADGWVTGSQPPGPKPDDGAEWDSGSHEWVPGEKVLSRRAKAKRHNLLAQCDWTQVGDNGFPLERLEAWQTYRQALRDITKQDGFPYDITWPTPPGDPVEGD